MLHVAAKLLGSTPDRKAFVYETTCGVRCSADTFDLVGEEIEVEDGTGDAPCPRCLPHLATPGLDAAGLRPSAGGVGDHEEILGEEDDNGLGEIEVEGEDEVLRTERRG